VPAAKAGAGVIADVSHEGVGDGVPECGDGHGDAGVRSAHAHRLGVVDHGKRVERVHHQGVDRIARRVRQDIFEGSLRAGRASGHPWFSCTGEDP